MTATVDTGLLFELVWAAAAAGIAVAVCFALAILGGVRSGEMRREGRAGGAVGYGVLAALSFAAIAALVVFGVAVIVSK